MPENRRKADCSSQRSIPRGTAACPPHLLPGPRGGPDPVEKRRADLPKIKAARADQMG
jgi:hypothetical protein